MTETPAFSSVYFLSNDEGYATVKDWSDEFEAKLYHTTDGAYNDRNKDKIWYEQSILPELVF